MKTNRKFKYDCYRLCNKLLVIKLFFKFLRFFWTFCYIILQLWCLPFNTNPRTKVVLEQSSLKSSFRLIIITFFETWISFALEHHPFKLRTTPNFTSIFTVIVLFNHVPLELCLHYHSLSSQISSFSSWFFSSLWLPVRFKEKNKNHAIIISHPKHSCLVTAKFKFSPWREAAPHRQTDGERKCHNILFCLSFKFRLVC